MPSLILSALRSENVHGAPNSRLMRFTDTTICIKTTQSNNYKEFLNHVIKKSLTKLNAHNK